MALADAPSAIPSLRPNGGDLGSSSDSSTSSSSSDGSDWERIGGAPNHQPDASPGDDSDGYEADDQISRDAADLDRVVEDATSGDSDVVWTGDGSSTPAQSDNSGRASVGGGDDGPEMPPAPPTNNPAPSPSTPAPVNQAASSARSAVQSAVQKVRSAGPALVVGGAAVLIGAAASLADGGSSS